MMTAAHMCMDAVTSTDPWETEKNNGSFYSRCFDSSSSVRCLLFFGDHLSHIHWELAQFHLQYLSIYLK